MKLADIDFKKLLPLFMRRDEFNNALADAISAPLRVFARECRKLSTFDSLDLLTDAELDSLADELNVFWYDKTLPPDKKRVLLANSDKVYMRMGTKAAVKMVVEQIFGPAEIEEFWQYAGGTPHYFRIRIENSKNLTPENERKLYNLISHVKRRSQWLERITTAIIAELNLRAGATASAHISYTLPLVDTWEDHEAFTAARGGGSATIETDESFTPNT